MQVSDRFIRQLADVLQHDIAAHQAQNIDRTLAR